MRTVHVDHSHRQEEGESVVQQQQVPNDITTGLTRVVCLLEDVLFLMRSRSRDRQRYQSQAGDKRDNQHTTEDDSAKPTWEVMETTSSSFHSCDAEPNMSPETLDTPDGATHMQDKLRWPHRAVSKERQAMSWKWLEPDTGAFRVKRLCRLGRLLLTRWLVSTRLGSTTSGWTRGP